MNKVIFASLLLASTTSLACYKTPEEQVSGHDDLIARSENIVLARATNAHATGEGRVAYGFELIRSISGSAPQKFEIEGRVANTESDLRNFDNHVDVNFWNGPSGRVANDTDCKIYPTFSVGATYLIFLDKPYHRKSFELILRTDGDTYKKDKWLQYVEAAIAGE